MFSLKILKNVLMLSLVDYVLLKYPRYKVPILLGYGLMRKRKFIQSQKLIV